MIEITDNERKQIQRQFPKAAIVTTKHRCYVATRETDDVGRFLLTLRNQPQPPSRRQLSRERLDDRYGHMFTDRSHNRRP